MKSKGGSDLKPDRHEKGACRLLFSYRLYQYKVYI